MKADRTAGSTQIPKERLSILERHGLEFKLGCYKVHVGGANLICQDLGMFLKPSP